MPDRIVVLDGYTLTPLPPGRTSDVDEPTWAPFEALGELTVYPRTPPDQVVERAAGAAYVLTNKTVIDADAFDQLSSLRCVGVLATGVNVVDLDAARAHGVTVTNVPDYAADSVAQHVIALMLALTNLAAEHDRAVREGEWMRRADFSFTLGPTTELAGKVLGIVGVGAIGARVARGGAGLGMRITAADTQSTRPEIPGAGAEIEWMDIDALFAAADVVSLNCPLTDATHHLVNADRLSRMKRGAVLINTARGALVDESALAEALRAGRIAAAAVDVLSTEPPPEVNPLLSAPRCIVTPHMAWATRESRCRLMHIAAENLRAFIAGQPVNVVNG